MFFVAVHGFKGSEVQSYVLAPGLHFEQEENQIFGK